MQGLSWTPVTLSSLLTFGASPPPSLPPLVCVPHPIDVKANLVYLMKSLRLGPPTNTSLLVYVQVFQIGIWVDEETFPEK